MPPNPSAALPRDGFSYRSGRFTTEKPYNLERVDVEELKRAFLPSLTDKGRKMLKQYPSYSWSGNPCGFVKG